jgi:hypothetical protein
MCRAAFDVIIRPLNACVVVIVNKCGSINVGDDVTGIGNTSRQVAKVNNFLGGGIGGAYFSFAGTKRSTVLTLPESTDRATIFENDATAHAAEFEERKKSAISDGTSELRTPTSVAVGGNSVGTTQLMRNSIRRTPQHRMMEESERTSASVQYHPK